MSSFHLLHRQENRENFLTALLRDRGAYYLKIIFSRNRFTVCSKYVSRYRIKLLMSIVPLKVIWLYSQRTTRLVIGEVIISAIRNSSNYGGKYTNLFFKLWQGHVRATIVLDNVIYKLPYNSQQGSELSIDSSCWNHSEKGVSKDQWYLLKK